MRVGSRVTAERWREVKRVVADALDVPRAERVALLDARCAGDPALRQEVDSLLATVGDDVSAGDHESLPGARAAIAAGTRALARDAAASRDAAVRRAEETFESESATRRLLEGALGTQYEVLRLLGRGGMGAVYLARERALERFVAVKVLRPDLATSAGSRERFRREARVAASLSHPGILPLHTFGEVGGIWYFVMGYVRGDSLAERLRLEGRLPPAEACRLLAELADALACAHRSGVVHRDVKPANILLDAESGRAMLADFGIARTSGAGDSLTLTGAVVGTPQYMSPEQAMGSGDVDARSDLWSLGAVGYAMLAGREPFAGASAASLIAQRIAGEPDALAEVAPWVPAPLADVIMRCLARDRAVRWADARALQEALVRAGGESPLAEPLRDLPGFGPYAVVWAVTWTMIALLPAHSTGDRVLLLLVALLVPFGLVLHLWHLGRQGPGLRELVRAACWPPEWWGMWWPQVFRRPEDLWPRLPWPARAVRGVLSAFFVAVPALVLVRQRIGGDGTVDGDPLGPSFLALQGGLVLGAGAAVAAAFAWAARRELPVPERLRLLVGATMPSAAWRTPRLARLLAPLRGVRAPERDVPADHPRAIDALVPLLPACAGDVAVEAAAVARRLVAAMDACDREAATIARDAGDAELDRLGARLAALEGEAPATPLAPSRAAESDEGRERDELRRLVEHELALVRRMRSRGELVAQRRAHLFDLLRALWTQLSVVHEAAHDDAAVGTQCARVRALCVEIAGAMAGDAPGA